MNLPKSLEKFGLSGSSLKIIAMLCMLCDHIAAVVLYRMIAVYSFSSIYSSYIPSLTTFAYILRGIGRIAFPIFIFLLVEGMLHTHNRWNYLLRMFVFALISELPFDFAFTLNYQQIKYGTLIDFTYQNVFFTLTLGLLAILCIDLLARQSWNIFLKAILEIIISIACMLAAFYLHVDYAQSGVLAIILMYFFRKYNLIGMLLACACVTQGIPFNRYAYIALIPAALYNGKRGLNVKWIFYLFYPIHLLLLWGLCLLLNIL